MGKVKTTDLYMNFWGIEANFDGVDATVLVEETVYTGLSIRGGLAWLVHLIEWEFPCTDVVMDAQGSRFNGALATRAGLAALPEINDAGVLDKVGISWTNAAPSHESDPIRHRFMPPMPLAAPALSMYINSRVSNAQWLGLEVRCRLGFTTVPMDAALYTEIAETWGWTV